MRIKRLWGYALNTFPRERATPDWTYERLVDIQLMGIAQARWARLSCEDDQCGEMFIAICRGRYFKQLEPYAADLLAWKDDPEREQPIIPIIRDRLGPRFYPIAVEAPQAPGGCLMDISSDEFIQFRKVLTSQARSGVSGRLTSFRKFPTDPG